MFRYSVDSPRTLLEDNVEMYQDMVGQLVQSFELKKFLVHPEVSIPLACEDFARTRIWQAFLQGLPDEEMVRIGMEEAAKVTVWESAQMDIQIDREPRYVWMQLHPLYFKLMMDQQKTIEGRAYKPSSHKNFPNIMPGDTVIFTISHELSYRRKQCVHFGLNPSSRMVTTVRAVHFGPLVQAVFHNLEPDAGELFQPMLTSISIKVLAAIVRAARYYEIPGYPELIRNHGFLGLEIEVVSIEQL